MRKYENENICPILTPPYARQIVLSNGKNIITITISIYHPYSNSDNYRFKYSIRDNSWCVPIREYFSENSKIGCHDKNEFKETIKLNYKKLGYEIVSKRAYRYNINTNKYEDVV